MGAISAVPRTLVEKIWDSHVVASRPGAPDVLAVDLHLVHEVTSPQAFTGLRKRGLQVRHPERPVATADHSVGTSEVEMVLATQCVLQRRPKTFEVRVDGRLAPGVTAKDVILALLARIGIGGGTGHVFEYRGEAIRALTMEQRMTICNMSIEGGARAGLIAPDDTTFEYVEGRAHAPRGKAWDKAVEGWRTLPSDHGATYDRTITIDAAA